MAKRKWVLD